MQVAVSDRSSVAFLTGVFCIGSYLVLSVVVSPRFIIVIVVVIAFRIQGNRDNPVPIIGSGERHTLGIAPGASDLIHRRAYDPAAFHDNQDLVVVGSHQRSHKIPTGLNDIGDLNPNTAPALHAVFTQRGPLGERSEERRAGRGSYWP